MFREEERESTLSILETTKVKKCHVNIEIINKVFLDFFAKIKQVSMKTFIDEEIRIS